MTTDARECGAVMPRTTPEGRFVCSLPKGHTDWHRCPMTDELSGEAWWADEKAALAVLPSSDNERGRE